MCVNICVCVSVAQVLAKAENGRDYFSCGGSSGHA